MDGAKSYPSPIIVSKPLSLAEGDPLSDPELFRSTIGSLQYLTITRPDICFTVNKLSQFVHVPTSSHWEACKRLLRYLKGTADHGLQLHSSVKLVIHGFTDSDWASDRDDRRSTSGYGIFLGSNLISWSSKKQAVVARSSTEAEYRALAHITSELCWLPNLLIELQVTLPTPLSWIDSLSAAALASNPVLHQRIKHIELDIHFVRDKVLNKSIEIRYVPTKEQVADVFTKALGTARFLYLKSRLKVVNGV
nr:secreted RxLR effector protein 161-like [Ziziphus jujuba var. spinosa]